MPTEARFVRDLLHQLRTAEVRAVRSRRRRRRWIGSGVGAVALAVAGFAGLSAITEANPQTDVGQSADGSTIEQASDGAEQILGEGSAESAIEEPLERWRSSPISNYFLRVDPTCFCDDTRTYVVLVEDGEAIASVSAGDAAPHHAMTDDEIWTPTTVEEVYELVRTYRDGYAGFGATATFELTLDDSGRWPTSLSLDPLVGGDDDELALRISLEVAPPPEFETDLVEVLIATGLVDAWTPVSEVLTTVTPALVPEASVSGDPSDRVGLEALVGLVSATNIPRNQIITPGLFVDPDSVDLPVDAIPAGSVVYSFTFDDAHTFAPNDEVVVTTGETTFPGRVLATGGGDPPMITLLISQADKLALARGGDSASIRKASSEPSPGPEGPVPEPTLAGWMTAFEFAVPLDQQYPVVTSGSGLAPGTIRIGEVSVDIPIDVEYPDTCGLLNSLINDHGSAGARSRGCYIAVVLDENGEIELLRAFSSGELLDWGPAEGWSPLFVPPAEVTVVPFDLVDQHLIVGPVELAIAFPLAPGVRNECPVATTDPALFSLASTTVEGIIDVASGEVVRIECRTFS